MTDLTPYRLSYNSRINSTVDDLVLVMYTEPLFCKFEGEVAVKVQLRIRLYQRAWGTHHSEIYTEKFVCSSYWVCETVFNTVYQKSMEVFSLSLETMPLLVNNRDPMINLFVKWRLEHGI